MDTRTQLYTIMASKACSCSSHGDIVRVTGTGSHKVWMVTGVAQILPFVSVSKNMFILGTGGNATSPPELTLVNTAKLSEAGLKVLEELGTVKHVIRLGDYHGGDDDFYVRRYGATLWHLPGTKAKPSTGAIEAKGVLGEGKRLPVPNTRLFEFRGVPRPEAALILQADPSDDPCDGILMTTDSVINFQGPDRHFSLLARLFGVFTGLYGCCRPGEGWLLDLAASHGPPEAGAPTLADDYQRLLGDDHEWSCLLPGHGPALMDGQCKQRLAKAIDEIKRKYPQRLGLPKKQNSDNNSNSNSSSNTGRVVRAAVTVLGVVAVVTIVRSLL